MLSLHTHAQLSGSPSKRIYKVLGISEALTTSHSVERILIDQRTSLPQLDLQVMAKLGFAGLVSDRPRADVPRDLLCVSGLSESKVVGQGDVVRIRDRGQVSVLNRRGANANFLLATERCNSYCLMCSQPPRDGFDDWRVDEILDLIPLIDEKISTLGITGGEPTLLGGRLAEIIHSVTQNLPNTQLNILSNARQFSDASLADVLTVDGSNVLWAVPLYADTAARHDYVVQADGAFEETLNGLYNLAERKAAIELRMVVHAQTVERLVQFSEFVWRSLPFVTHVAFMGLEPMGFAKRNRELLYVDPVDYGPVLETAVWYLQDRGIPTSIYNTPLCLLSRDIWPLARQSISDWKNRFVPECDECDLQSRCSGFFKSAGPEWRSRGIQPIKEECTI